MSTSVWSMTGILEKRSLRRRLGKLARSYCYLHEKASCVSRYSTVVLLLLVIRTADSWYRTGGLSVTTICCKLTFLVIIARQRWRPFRTRVECCDVSWLNTPQPLQLGFSCSSPQLRFLQSAWMKKPTWINHQVWCAIVSLIFLHNFQ